MVTLITAPLPGPKFKGETGADRAQARLQWHIKHAGDVQPTRETRQNRRFFERKARKMSSSGAAQ